MCGKFHTPHVNCAHQVNYIDWDDVLPLAIQIAWTEWLDQVTYVMDLPYENDVTDRRTDRLTDRHKFFDTTYGCVWIFSFSLIWYLPTCFARRGIKKILAEGAGGLGD